MSNVLLMTKLKNGLKKVGNYECNLSNININGSKRGCSGFVINPENGVIVYINTEKSCYAPLSKLNLVRFAKHKKDYGGAHSRNEWANDDEIVSKIVAMLNNESCYEAWKNKCCNN